jgi:hypothetical protein
MDTMTERFDAKFEALRQSIDGIKDSVAAASLRAFAPYIALAAAMFGTMARGFGWI